MTKHFKKDDRVVTQYGNGTVKGFEVFYYQSKDRSVVLEDTVSPTFDGRIAVELDEGHTWAFKHTDCYFYAREIEPETI